jgi:hypothetical protein
MAGVQGEIQTDTVQIDHARYRIIGAVQGPSLLNPLPDKVTIGEHTRADDVLLASWVVSNLRGGLGVARLDEATQADRYRYGTAWVLQDAQNSLPPAPVELTAGIPAGTEARAGVTYQGTAYIIFNTKVRLFDPVTPTFATPAETGYVDLAANPTATLTLRLGTTQWLVIADANGYLKFDGTTWAYVTGNGTTIPRAQFLQRFDKKVYALDGAGQLWVTPDLTTWTKLTGGVLPSDTAATGLDLFFDPSGDPYLHAPTRTALWLYDHAADAWEETRLRALPAHASGGKGHAQWRDEYYLSSGMTVYHYVGGAIAPASLDRDDGLPKDYQGDIVALEPMPSWLAAGLSGAVVASDPPLYEDGWDFEATRAANVSATAAIYLWTGSAWQPFWVSPQRGAALRFLHYSDANGTYRLWWGASSRVYYVEFPKAVFNPRTAPTWPFAQTAFLDTGLFDGDWPEMPKLAVRTKVRATGTSATERILVFYRVDNTGPWLPLATVDTDGLTTVTLETTPGAGDAIPFYEWEYHLEWERGGDAAKSPVLIFCKLEYARRTEARWGYRVQLIVDEDVAGRTPAQQVAALQALADTKRLVQFEYRLANHSPITRKCLVSQITAITYPGMETSGHWNVALLEP